VRGGRAAAAEGISSSGTRWGLRTVENKDAELKRCQGEGQGGGIVIGRRVVR
jgi:hypothetical protein